MGYDDVENKPGHRWHPSEQPETDEGEGSTDKGKGFIDPLTERPGPKWIDTTKESEPADDGDIRGGERRGAVLDNRSQVKNSSANRVKDISA